MPGRKFVLQLTCTGLMAAALGGCGMIPVMARGTTAAALAPFTTAAQAVAVDLQLVGYGFSALNQQAAHTRQITQLTRAQIPAQSPVSSVQPSPVSYQMPTSTNASRAKASKTTDKSAGLDILPRDVLARLTPDQAGLQRAAQTAALTASVGETIFWHLDGREGTAMTETENNIGGFKCRTFVQTLAFEDNFEKASVTACRTEGGAWTQSF